MRREQLTVEPPIEVADGPPLPSLAIHLGRTKTSTGYPTKAADRGVPLTEAREQSKHRSVQQASSYDDNATWRSGRAARLL